MYLIEVLGTPKSGKSKIIKEFSRYLLEKGRRVHLISTGFRDCPFRDVDNQEFEKQIWSVFSLINEFLEIKNSKDEFDFVIFDRGLWDRKVMLEYFNKKGKISHYEYNYLNFILERFLNKIDLVIFILTDAEVSIRRNLEAKGKIRFNKNELKEINMICEELIPSISSKLIKLNGNESLTRLLETIKNIQIELKFR